MTCARCCASCKNATHVPPPPCKSSAPWHRRVTLPTALAGTQAPRTRGPPQFVSQSSWDEQAVGRRARTLMAATLADAAGGACSDDTTCPKAGKASVGVPRQDGGALGKKANLPGGRKPALRRQGRPRAVGACVCSGLTFGWRIPARLDKAGVPAGEPCALTKAELAPEGCSTPRGRRTSWFGPGGRGRLGPRGQRPLACGTRRARLAPRALGGDRPSTTSRRSSSTSAVRRVLRNSRGRGTGRVFRPGVRGRNLAREAGAPWAVRPRSVEHDEFNEAWLFDVLHANQHQPLLAILASSDEAKSTGNPHGEQQRLSRRRGLQPTAVSCAVHGLLPGGRLPLGVKAAALPRPRGQHFWLPGCRVSRTI